MRWSVILGGTPEQGGMANDLAESFDAVEDDGYDVSAIVAARSVRGARASRATRTGKARGRAVRGRP
jgi:hypothetical protein